MNQISIAWRRLNAGFDLAWMCACVSRLLLLLAAVEIITMPLTQYIWSFDNFLHGGQDFELGLLMVVTCLCFVLLRAQHCRQRMEWLLAIGTLLLRVFQQRDWSRMVEFARLSCALEGPLPGSPSEFCSLPLLI